MDDLTATYQLKCLLACMDNNNLHSDNTHEMCFNYNNSDGDESTQLQEVGTLNQSHNDIREEQDKLSIRFSKLNLTRNNETQFDLLHLLKASNTSLILFDRTTYRLRRH